MTLLPNAYAWSTRAAKRDTRVGRNTRIEVVTEGVLTRMLNSDPTLEGVGVVIIQAAPAAPMTAFLERPRMPMIVRVIDPGTGKDRARTALMPRGDAWSLAEENRDLLLMGAYRAGADPAVDEALELRASILDFIMQPCDTHERSSASVARLIAEFGA